MSQFAGLSTRLWTDLTNTAGNSMANNESPQSSWLALTPGEVRALIAEARVQDEELPPKASPTRRDVGLWLLDYDANDCAICLTPIDASLPRYHPGALQLDHIVPTGMGGPDTWGNIQVTHARCNNAKNMRTDGYPPPARAVELLRESIYDFENPLPLLPQKIEREKEFLRTMVEYTAVRMTELENTDPASRRVRGLQVEIKHAQKGVRATTRRVAKLEAQLAALSDQSGAGATS